LPKYRITHANGTTEEVDIELITPVEQAGTPINKALFDSIKNDLTAFGNRIDLSNVYNAGTLTTATKTITDDLSSNAEWEVVSDKEIYNKFTGTTIKAGSITSSKYMKLFVDGDATTFGVNNDTTITITKPYSYKLKSIKAKIGIQSSKYLRIGTTSALNDGTYQSFACDVNGTDTTFSFSNNTTTQTSFYMCGVASTSASASQSYDVKLYELYAMTYDASCNVVTYTYTDTIKDGTIIKVRTPSNINTAKPTVFKVGSYEVCVGVVPANTDFELVYRNSALSIYNQVRNISVKTGTVADGDTIPQTAGYNHYAYMVSPTMSSYLSVYNTYELRFVGYRIVCEVDQSTRKVTSRAYIEASSSNSGSPTTNYTSITANYIEIAWN
jgi:hypothetical protein